MPTRADQHKARGYVIAGVLVLFTLLFFGGSASANAPSGSLFARHFAPAAALDTPTETPPLTDTDTPTSTPTPTVADTDTPTGTPVPPTAVLIVHVTWQGISQPNSTNTTQTIAMTLRSTSGGIAYDYPSGYTTDASGFVTFDVSALPNDTYNIRVKGARNLASCSQVVLTGGPATQKEMGVQLAGDANNSNNTNTADYGIMHGSFDKAYGRPGYDARVDFNNSDIVNAVDFVLLKGSFGIGGCAAIRPGNSR